MSSCTKISTQLIVSFSCFYSTKWYKNWKFFLPLFSSFNWKMALRFTMLCSLFSVFHSNVKTMHSERCIFIKCRFFYFETKETNSWKKLGKTFLKAIALRSYETEMLKSWAFMPSSKLWKIQLQLNCFSFKISLIQQCSKLNFSCRGGKGFNKAARELS